MHCASVLIFYGKLGLYSFFTFPVIFQLVTGLVAASGVQTLSLKMHNRGENGGKIGEGITGF